MAWQNHDTARYAPFNVHITDNRNVGKLSIPKKLRQIYYIMIVTSIFHSLEPT